MQLAMILKISILKKCCVTDFMFILLWQRCYAALHVRDNRLRFLIINETGYVAFTRRHTTEKDFQGLISEIKV